MLYQLSYFRIFSFLFRDDFVILRIVGQSFTQVNSFPPYSTSLSSQKINFKIFRFFRAISASVFAGNCGRRWIRTTEGINQQIYSLPHLATLVFSLFCFFRTISALDSKSSVSHRFEPMEGIEPTTPRLQITCSSQLSYIGESFSLFERDCKDRHYF